MAGFDKLMGSLKALDGALTETSKRAEEAANRVRDASSAAAGSLRDFRAVADEIPRAADAIDDLRNRISGLRGEFAVEIQEQLDLLAIGGQRLDEFLGKFGDVVVEVEGGTAKIDELLEGLDVRGRQQEVQELVRAINDGSKDVGDALDFLNREGGRFAETITSWVAAFQQGEISLERLQEVLNSIGEQFDGTDLEQLADALAKAARDGML